jgi:YHS domain-containing protein
MVAYTNEKGELICPVLGEVIPSADKAAGFQDYEGKRYYFCCAGCPETFAKEPAKYAK